ncbi:Alpha-mannosidase-like protein, partial [human gut metagenome]
MDLGLNRYSFAIFSHKGDVGTDTQLEARKFITPMTAYICKKHNGALGTNYSFGSVSSNDVIVRAIKKAENSDEIIIRLNEGTNKTINKFSLTLGNGIEDAKEVFASEEYKGKAEIKDGKLITSFKPYEIKSFALKLKSGEKVKAEKAVPIELPLDKNIITKQGKCGDYDYTVPFEIVPDEINSNGYKFIINRME